MIKENLFAVVIIAVIFFFWSESQKSKGKEEYELALAGLFKFSFYIAIASVVVGFLDMPSEYYFHYLRIVLFSTAIIGFISIPFSSATTIKLNWVFIAATILFNPLFPIILGSGAKPIWIVINIAYLLFLRLVIVMEDTYFQPYKALKQKEWEEYKHGKLKELNLAYREKKSQHAEFKSIHNGKIFEYFFWYFICIAIGLLYYKLGEEYESPIIAVAIASSMMSILIAAIHVHFSKHGTNLRTAAKELEDISSDIYSVQKGKKAPRR